ncbi:tetratricopeptide repeat protein [Paraglaciecola sp.]|uniref:tetratricopeptide repeat protein n=1 Tax=Paraglaciecola sp. TaxID=1920173 RepID=UPI003EFAB9B6
MSLRFGIVLQILFLVIVSCHLSARPVGKEDKNNPKAHIEYALSQQKSDPNEAYKALDYAYRLATEQNKQHLIVRVLIEQAQTAKLEKKYLMAEKYLFQAERVMLPLNNARLSVDMLSNMSSIQRYLKNYERSMDYIHRALVIARKSNEPSLVFKSLLIKGTLLQTMKRFEDAVTVYLLAQRHMSNETNRNVLRLYRNTANAYKNIKEFESSIRYYKKALAFLESNENEAAMPNTIIELAKTQAQIGQYSEAIENAKRSLTMARTLKNEKQILKSLSSLSIFYRKISSYEDALINGLEAIELNQKNNSINGLAASLNSIGLVYLHLNQSENAKAYFSQVIDIASAEINPKYRAAALRDLAKLLSADGQHNKAIELSNEAYEIYERVGDRSGLATVKKNIGYVYYQMGKETDAIQTYHTAITLFESLKDVWNQAETQAYLAIVYSNVDISESVSLAKNSLELANRIGAKALSELAYSALILAEEKRHNYKQALAYAKTKEALTDEIKTDTINKRSAEMYIILDVEKKERAFERLKREKSLISLELDNEKNKLSLLEKENKIAELQNKNTLLIASLIALCLIISVLVVGRVYLKTKYTTIFMVLLFVALILLSFNSFSVDLIKTTTGDSALDVRPKYTHAILKKSLELSTEKFGPFELVVIDKALSNDLKRWMIYDGIDINVAMSMASPDWEYLTLPIRIPIRRGVGSYRLLAIHEKNQNTFKDIASVKALKALTVGVQEGWILNEVLDEEGFILVKSTSYDSTFKMLDKRRFDFIPRGIHEVYDELAIREKELSSLMIEPRLAIYLPQPYYIFVSPKAPRIAQRIEFGLEKMIAEGVLQEMFNQYFADFIEKANLSNRTIIHLDNKYLTKKTPIERKELWLKFDLENAQ